MDKDEVKYTTLDTEQCKWWVNNLFGMAKEKACNSHNFDDGEEMQAAQDKIIKSLEIVEEFERAQIITGGRLNGRTYAYQCGLEDGKRKALEQQLSEDCISRQEVEYLISGGKYVDEDYEQFIDRLLKKLENLPPVTPTQRWIPISERLPDEIGTYLVTLEYKEHGIGVKTLWYYGKQMGWDLRVADVVIAWKPLPQPYEIREEKDD